MRKILKFEIPLIEDKFTLNLPARWRFLSFQVQDRKPMIWIGGDFDKEKVEVQFQIVGTGDEMPENSDYLGTIQMPPFVWHLFLPLF